MNEFDFINRYLKQQTQDAQVVLGIGDDAAIVRPQAGMDLHLSSDMLLENRHFFANTAAADLAHKVMAVNLSDMAAMGATPKWALLSVALPKLDEAWLNDFCEHLFAIAKEYRVCLIGGDTTKGNLTFNVTIIGQAPSGQALRRDAAQLGDDVWVSGQIGLAAAALNHHWNHVRLPEAVFLQCEQKRLRPTPRVALGEAILSLAHAAQDVSDGLWQDLAHIAKASDVGMNVDFALIPTLSELKAHSEHREWVLSGGDDYELIFTAPKSAREAIIKAGLTSKTSITRIGEVVKEAGVRVFENQVAIELEQKGFDHFHE